MSSYRGGSASRESWLSFWFACALASCVACPGGTSAVAKEPATTSATAPPVERPAPGLLEIYRGSPEAPIAGLWLSPKPVVFVNDPAGIVPELETQKRIAKGEDITFSRDWRRFTRSRYERVQDRPETLVFLDEKEVQLTGRAGLALDSAGRTSVAWTAPDKATGQVGTLSILGLAGELQSQRPFERLQWVDVAAEGALIALGTLEETLVVDRSGAPVARFRSAERGILSPDGAWLALERGGGESRRFSLEPVRGSPVEFAVETKAIDLSFDARSSRVVRVAPDMLQTYRLDRERPAIESELAPPDGFAWRSAAFSPEGRLAAGRIRIARPPQRQPADPPGPDTPGQAWLAVDLWSDSAASPASVVWEVADWNHLAPEVAFGGEALFTVAWPSAFEVRP